MKKLIRWLAKVFKADITVERIIYKEVYKPLEDKLSGRVKPINYGKARSYKYINNGCP